MSVRVVYVLVSREEDCFYEMFLLSLYSLRKHCPDRKVSLVMDPETYDRVIAKDDPLLETIEPLRVEIPDGFSPMLRSRYLKTRLRSIIEGDFLYLDTDTVVCESLDEIDSIPCDIAAVTDENGPAVIKSAQAIEHCKKAGFGELKRVPYYNGGVFLVRDSVISRKFFEVWHELWLRSVENGIPFDQPGLSKANRDTGFPIKELAGEWNCQVCTPVGAQLFYSAKIVHYFASYSSFMKMVILPHVKSPDRLDDFALGIADNPRGMGFEIYNENYHGRARRCYSGLLFKLRRYPMAYQFLRSGVGILSRPFSWFLSSKNDD
jgi:hypothetical protein